MSRPQELDYHIARLLLLLRHFGSRKQLVGLTKLAKLDFLLRYPSFTERLMETRNLIWPEGTEPSDNEINAVESRMIRYKYGPWDDLYYPLLGALVGLGLASIERKGRTLRIQLTQEGQRRAAEISEAPEWELIEARAKTLRRSFDVTGTKLKNMIYDELPDVIDRPHRAKI